MADLSPPEPEAPEVISHYRLVTLLGRGGMGVVYRAVDRRDGSTVAIKLLHSHLESDDTFRQRFEREAHVAALLRSPYTVHLHDYGFAEGRYFIVMQYVEGETLKQALRTGPLQLQRALRIAAQVARALEEAEARGVVHRDIKPDNILLSSGDSVKVSDFGIARQLGAGTLTVPGAFVGTLAYAAPEIALGKADHRSDIYSLGATLYHMLTGRPPYGGGPLEMLRHHADTPLPVEPLAGLPPAVVGLAKRCLEKDPGRRYQSASVLAGELEHAAHSAPAAEPEAPPEVQEPAPVAETEVEPAEPEAPTEVQEAAPITPSGVLEIRHGDEVYEYALTGDTIAIGRAGDNQVVVSDPLISRHHARLEWAEGLYRITDLGSANGTRVNDAEIEPKEQHPLRDGDTIQIGGFALALRLPSAAEEVARGSATLEEKPVREAESLTFIAPAAPRLIVATPQWTKEFPLEGDVLTLGRDPTNDIVVDDRVVSRHHARLEPAEGGHGIVDLGSANGLTLEGERVPERMLVDGDMLWIAETVSLTYRSVAEAIETPTATERLDLRQSAVLTIGRHPQNNITLDYPAVSRMHARVAPGPARGSYVIEDAGSSNGTFVNGDRVAPGEPRPLRPGDIIRVGPVKFVFARETLEQVDESRDLRLDALHLNKFVGKGLNLLQDISLSIYPREFVAIVGVSGSGKSTLLDALNGFRPASEGAVLVNGTDLYRNFDAYRTDLGYVPQDDIIHTALTVYKALDYAARLRLPADTTPTERQRRIMEVLETLGLTERRDVPIQKLSGGQRKRVCIGAELLTRPGLFFLDEATSGLDPGTESQMMRVLRKLADQGHTIVLVTHATKNVMLCDHVVFLAKGGQLAYYGPPEQALPHFGVEDFDAIYEKLDGELTPEAWAEKYRQSPQYQEFAVARLQEKYGALVHTPPPHEISPSRQPISERVRGNGMRAAPAARSTGVSALRQLWILSARYLNIIHRDRMNLALLFLIAPLLGTIDLIAWPRRVFDLVEGDATRAMVMLFLSALIPFLVGALSSVREIVKETPVYKRERTVVLKILPYLLSKVWVGFLFALYHAGALLALKLLAVDFSHVGTAEVAQFYVTLALAAMSGVLWGLLISTLVPREEQAMLLVIVVVVVQMVFSGALVTLSQLGIVGEVLGNVTSTKWVLQALTAAAQVKTGQCEGASLADCRLPGIGVFETDAERRVYLGPIDDRYGDVFGADVFTSWGALVLLMVGLFALLFWLQKRKDVV